MTKVSIIVRTYNYGHFIADTLESICDQTYKTWECIIIDDGSTDDTKKVVEPFLKRDDFHYIYQDNGGPSPAMNTGLEYISGDFIVFLDADDKITPDKLALHVAHLQNKPHIDVSFSSARYFQSQNPTELYYSMTLGDREWIPQISCSGYEAIYSYIYKNITPINTVMIRRSSLPSSIVFNIVMPGAEDWEFFLRLALNGLYFEFLKNTKALALIRVHDRSTSSIDWRMERGHLQLRKNIVTSVQSVDFLTTEEKNKILKKNRLKSIKLCRKLIIKHNFKRAYIKELSLYFSLPLVYISLCKALFKTATDKIQRLKIQPETNEEKTNDLFYYSHNRHEMLTYIPKNSKIFLEVGCGDSSFAKSVMHINNISEYWGLELDSVAAKQGRKSLTNVLLGDAEILVDELPNNYFDTVIFNDSLEHLVDPFIFLEKIKAKLKKRGSVVASIPNVRHYKNLYKLIFKKQWRYEEFGTLDRTHLRFFTQESIMDTFENAGFTVNHINGINGTRKLKIRILGPLTLGLLSDIPFLQFAVNASANRHED